MTREELIEERAKELRLMRFEYNTTEMLTKWENLYSVFKNVYIAKAQEQVDWFLSQPEVALIDTEAKLPEIKEFKGKENVSIIELGRIKSYELAQQDMLKGGWVKKL